MNIWLITIGEPLPDDPGPPRLLRTGLLAGHLAARGHDVVWWNSTFDHVRKMHRAAADTEFTLDNGVCVRLLHGCGYRRNISPRRILDHVLVARRFARLAPTLAPPDVVLASLPTLELALAATRYGQAHGVPVAVDIRDLWPDYLVERAPAWLRPLARLALAPMARQAAAACQGAVALTGNAPAFVDWGVRRAGRKGAALDRPFPHAYPLTPLSPEVRARAGAFWDSRGVADDGTFTACFFGVFSRKCDLAVVIDAAARLEREGLALRVVLCGSGEEEARLRHRAAGLRSVLFPGWVGAAAIQVLMGRAHAGLAPYRNHAGFIGNLPNKPIEYLAGGLPVVSSLTGGEADLLYREGCAVSFREGDAENLAAVLHGLAEQADVRARMAAVARSVFAARFSADRVYAAMADWLETVANSRRVKSG